MKKKWLSSTMSVILAGVMVASLMTGCGQQNAQKESSVQKEESKLEESKVEESKVEESSIVTEETEELTYPLDTDLELQIYVDEYWVLAPEYASADQSPFHTKLAENTGDTIDWQFPAQGADRGVALNLLWQEEVLPHIIVTSANASKGAEWIADGVIYDLTEYIPKYAPDYYEFLINDENLMKSLVTADGRLYSIAGFRESTYNITYLGPVIRKDWLDECDLDFPVTLEDWEKVLVTFKDKYDAYFGFATWRYNAAIGIASGVGAQASLATRYYVDDNNKVQLGNAQPEWKEMLEVLHRWYEMGLLDKDFALQEDPAVRSKALKGDIGVSITAMSQLTNFQVDADAEGTGAQWVGFEYPRTAPGEPTVAIQTDRSLYAGGGAVITTSCSEEELILALQLLNYGFTEEGIMFHNYGTEGESYTINAEGEVEWTDLILNDPAGRDAAVKKYSAVHSGQISVQQARFVQLKNSEASRNAVYKWVENTVADKYTMPKLARSTDENARYSDLSAPMDTYISEMAVKFVTGDEDLADFDKFLKKLDEMGLQEILKIQQAAYDRYLGK